MGRAGKQPACSNGAWRTADILEVAPAASRSSQSCSRSSRSPACVPPGQRRYRRGLAPHPRPAGPADAGRRRRRSRWSPVSPGPGGPRRRLPPVQPYEGGTLQQAERALRWSCRRQPTRLVRAVRQLVTAWATATRDRPAPELALSWSRSDAMAPAPSADVSGTPPTPRHVGDAGRRTAGQRRGDATRRGCSRSTSRCSPGRATTRRWRSTRPTTRSPMTSPSRWCGSRVTPRPEPQRGLRLRQLHGLRGGRDRIPGRPGLGDEPRRRTAEHLGGGQLRLRQLLDLCARGPAVRHPRRAAERRNGRSWRLWGRSPTFGARIARSRSPRSSPASPGSSSRSCRSSRKTRRPAATTVKPPATATRLMPATQTSRDRRHSPRTAQTPRPTLPRRPTPGTSAPLRTMLPRPAARTPAGTPRRPRRRNRPRSRPTRRRPPRAPIRRPLPDPD